MPGPGGRAPGPGTGAAAGAAAGRIEPSGGAAGSPTSWRTLLMSAPLSNGFEMWPSACACWARPSSNASKVPARRSTGMCRRAGSDFTASQTSYPFRRGMTTSARITSGLSSRALVIASSPLFTDVTLKSSFANVIPTTFWIVIESSARRRFLGM
jgi:hypothetical protein